jgi:alpha-glucosidase
MGEWWRGAVIYQIYPRSFRDSNGDGVGDLRGITEKLPYVADLGVDGIWLSPFFRSPMKDYGYDVSDYCDVDPLFGTLADFDALLARAHELGLKVIIDQVYSHTSDEHPWFKESRASRDNPKAQWYVWADAKPDGTPPNNWQSLFGAAAWAWDSRRRQYYLHNFLIEQPDLNVANPKVADALLDAARFWLQRGVDGFRLDVVNFYTHDPLLRDNPVASYRKTPPRPFQFQRQLYSRSQPETLAFVARLRALADSLGGRYLLGEIGDDDPLARQREYTEGENRLHSAYSFFILDARQATAQLFRDAMEGWRGSAGWPSWSLTNHDVRRYATRFAGDDPARSRLLMAVLLCLRGAAYLYQGDELGLPNGEVPFERLRDPEAIAFWPNGIGRDGARTPMPWRTDEKMAGFTSAEDAWLPLDPRHRALAAETQRADAGSMFAFTKAMIALRRAHIALREGDWVSRASPQDVLMFERVHADERLLCAFNFTDAETRLAPPAPLDAIAWPLPGRVEAGAIILPPFGGTLARLRG